MFLVSSGMCLHFLDDRLSFKKTKQQQQKEQQQKAERMLTDTGQPAYRKTFVVFDAKSSAIPAMHSYWQQA